MLMGAHLPPAYNDRLSNRLGHSNYNDTQLRWRRPFLVRIQLARVFVVAAARMWSPMSSAMHSFAEGDRVRARRRRDFPDGTVLKLMALDYLLIRWDSDVLETAHHSELDPAAGPSRSTES
jgi:hypothetical protein